MTKRALITGASSGLGFELAQWFARRGVVVHAAARRLDRLEELAKLHPGLVLPLQLDVSKADAAHDAIAALDAQTGGFDLVIANAGVGQVTNTIEWSLVRPVLDVNIMGAAATLAAVIPGMVARKRGQLVGISSLAAFVTLKRTATYNASKAFLTSWLDNVRLDVAKHGIDVTVIHPGFVKSELTAQNEFPMPFLLETADAADRMGRAIERKAKSFSYPWQTTLATSVFHSLPRAVQRFVASRLP